MLAINYKRNKGVGMYHIQKPHKELLIQYQIIDKLEKKNLKNSLFNQFFFFKFISFQLMNLATPLLSVYSRFFKCVICSNT